MKIKAIATFSGASFSMISGETRTDVPDDVAADLIASALAESAEDKGAIPGKIKKIIDEKKAARKKAVEAIEKETEEDSGSEDPEKEEDAGSEDPEKVEPASLGK